MTPELSAIAALALYALIGLMLIVRQVRACTDGLSVWILHIIGRLYTPNVFSQRIEQRCPFPATGAALILANHRSPVDPAFIFSSSCIRRDRYAIRVVEFMTASEYCDIGGPLGWLIRTMRVIPVDRNGADMEAAKEALKRLKAGRLVGVFPEGRLNTGEGLLPGNPGISWLALRGGAPVYPVYIHNAPQAEGMVEPFYQFQKVHVTFGEAIDLSSFRGKRVTTELLEDVTRHLMESLAELGGTYVQCPQTRLPPVNLKRNCETAAAPLETPQAKS
jgi:1-acyl-sn-glycerol-3-phosphate acyltransferase